MSTLDMIVRNGKVYLNGDLQEIDIAIDQGRIAGLTKDSSHLRADEVIDAKGLVILPGAIDTHVHSFARGYDFEDFENATTAAALGGVTTVVDMPMEKPLVGTVRDFKEKLDPIKTKAAVDYGLLGAPCQFDVPVEEGITEIPKLVKNGAVGFKLFMDNTAPPGWYVGFNSGQLFDAFSQIGKTRTVAATHCEDSFVIDHLTGELKADNRSDPFAHHDSRPPLSEALGIMRATMIAKATNCRLHTVHVSIAEGVDIVNQAKREGYPITSETCPHYLLLSTEDLKRSNRVKCNPPVRTREQVEMLWDALRAGLIDTIGSDHAPVPQPDTPDVWKVSARGLTSVELTLPLMVNEWYKNRRLTLERLVKVLCENPAKIYGLLPAKGVIQVGSDADLVIFNMKTSRVVDSARMRFKDPSNAWSPFDDRKLRGRIERVVIRGQTVVENRSLVEKPGFGRFIPHIPSSE